MTDARRTRRPRRALRIALLVTAVLAAALGVTAAIPVLSGRTDPPVAHRAAAQHAIDAARESDAADWAPELLATATDAWRGALDAYHHEAARFLPLRNFRDVAAAFDDAERKADAARDAAVMRRDQARLDAEQEIALAEQSLGRTDSVSKTVPLARSERMQLRRAKMALAEARILYDQGEFLQTSLRAKEASTDAQRALERMATLASRYADADKVREWRDLVRSTIAWSRKTGRPAIVVLKEKNRLVLYDDGRPIRSYGADLGANVLEVKQRAGDVATPEGRYHIVRKKDQGRSRYHKALLLNYPNASDRRRFDAAKRAGEIPRGAAIGGLIEIHGDGGRGTNWTNGCVALSNADMDDLFRRVAVGTPVTIVGGDGDGAFADLVRRFGNHKSPGGEQ